MTLREEIDELARRLEQAGWVFGFDVVRRPDDLREHDVAAVDDAEELLGFELPSFLRAFALDVGVIFLLGHAAEGSRLSDVMPELTSEDEAVSRLPMLMTVPLPSGVSELEWAIEELDDLCLPIIEDTTSAAGLSGGPPTHIIFDRQAPERLDLFIDMDADDPVGVDLEAYIRRCLSQGGVFHLPDDERLAALCRELGQGLGAFETI